MPAVPKPSQTKSAIASRAYRARQKKGKNTLATTTERSSMVLALQRLPKRGNLHTVLEAVRTGGGMNKEEITKECAKYSMSTGSVKHAIYLAGKLNLLR